MTDLNVIRQVQDLYDENGTMLIKSQNLNPRIEINGETYYLHGLEDLHSKDVNSVQIDT